MMSKRAAKVASMGDARFAVEWKSRSCTVGQRNGYFHCWEDTQLYGVNAVVEFPDGVRRVLLGDIAFCDEENAALQHMNEYHRMELMPNQQGD